MTGLPRKWRAAVDKVLNYLALARKGGRAELGEEPVGIAARALKAHLILVAGDASDHTWRRAKSFAAGGRTSLAIAAITDVQLALAMVTSLGEPEKYKAVVEVLTAKAEKAKKRQAEAKAHQRNLRKGKKK